MQMLAFMMLLLGGLVGCWPHIHCSQNAKACFSICCVGTATVSGAMLM